MMSDLPAEITKHIFDAPPFIMRSTRYSLTALGLSTPPSNLLPTGRSSFENARGCILEPAPAAGIIPHMGPPFWRTTIFQSSVPAPLPWPLRYAPQAPARARP